MGRVSPLSSDRLIIDASLVRCLITSQFPQWANLPIRKVQFDGWDNSTFRLGDDMAVRLPSAKRYVQQVDKERRWLPRLSPHLPLPIPVPLVMGEPGDGYPFPWSVYRWIDGDVATQENISDLVQFALDLAQFLSALQRIDTAGGPPPGMHNFHRGGSLVVYDQETRDAIAALYGEIDAEAATAIWEAALAAEWKAAPVWVHGDIASNNLLVKDGRLSTIIDFGCSCVGDPACDLVIAWTFFSGESREAFRTALPHDHGTWARARGWALWKALIILAAQITTNQYDAAQSRRIIADLVTEVADSLT